MNLEELKNLMDIQTRTHCDRVCAICVKLSDLLNINKKEELLVAASLHDIGKHYIPCWLLNAPRKLTNVERYVIDMHSVYGYRVLKDKGFGELTSQIVLFHHGLDKPKPNDIVVEEEVLCLFNILSVSDIYDALISDRPYRAGLSVKEALDVLKGEVDSKWYDALQQVI